MTMEVFLGAFPVLPGKEDEPRKFAQETLAKGEELEASQRRYGVTKEEWSLQQTPMGSLVIVHFECSDVAAVFAGIGSSNDEFDVWFKGRVLEICGVDLAAPSDDPLPEVILAWPS
jgi:hypothetical protein